VLPFCNTFQGRSAVGTGSFSPLRKLAESIDVYENRLELGYFGNLSIQRLKAHFDNLGEK
jgi:hypothetical protein